MKVILTVRDDWVAQLGSLMRAKRTGVWHSWVRADRRDIHSFSIEPNAFIEYANRCSRLPARMRELGESHDLLELSYEEDILAGAPASFQQVFDFVGIPRVEITRLVSEKVAPPPEDFITNIAELREFEAKVKAEAARTDLLA